MKRASIRKATRSHSGNVKRTTSVKPVVKRNSVVVNTAKFDRIKGEFAKEQPTRVRVGVLASRGGNARHQGSNLSLIDIAHVHEFGAPFAAAKKIVPERSFIRRTFSITEGRGGAWLPSFTARLTKAVITGKMDMATAMGILGQRGVAEVRRTITSGAGIPPPLKDATIKRKGSSRPLVDTGQLINSISYELIFGDASPAEVV